MHQANQEILPAVVTVDLSDAAAEGHRVDTLAGAVHLLQRLVTLAVPYPARGAAVKRLALECLMAAGLTEASPSPSPSHAVYTHNPVRGANLGMRVRKAFATHPAAERSFSEYSKLVDVLRELEAAQLVSVVQVEGVDAFMSLRPDALLKHLPRLPLGAGPAVPLAPPPGIAAAPAAAALAPAATAGGAAAAALRPGGITVELSPGSLLCWGRGQPAPSRDHVVRELGMWIKSILKGTSDAAQLACFTTVLLLREGLQQLDERRYQQQPLALEEPALQQHWLERLGALKPALASAARSQFRGSLLALLRSGACDELVQLAQVPLDSSGSGGSTHAQVRIDLLLKAAKKATGTWLAPVAAASPAAPTSAAAAAAGAAAPAAGVVLTAAELRLPKPSRASAMYRLKQRLHVLLPGSSQDVDLARFACGMLIREGLGQLDPGEAGAGAAGRRRFQQLPVPLVPAMDDRWQEVLEEHRSDLVPFSKRLRGSIEAALAAAVQKGIVELTPGRPAGSSSSGSALLRIDRLVLTPEELSAAAPASAGASGAGVGTGAGAIQVVSTAEDAAAAVAELREEPMLALAVEAAAERSADALLVALAPAAGGNVGGAACYVFHLHPGLSPAAREGMEKQLAGLLEDGSVGKLVHGFARGGEALYYGLGVRCAGLWDTQVAFGLMQFIQSIGVAPAAAVESCEPIGLTELLQQYSLLAGPGGEAGSLDATSLRHAVLSFSAVQYTASRVRHLLALRPLLEQDLGPAAAMRVDDLSAAYSEWRLESQHRSCASAVTDASSGEVQGVPAVQGSWFQQVLALSAQY